VSKTVQLLALVTLNSECQTLKGSALHYARPRKDVVLATADSRDYKILSNMMSQDTSNATTTTTTNNTTTTTDFDDEFFRRSQQTNATGRKRPGPGRIFTNWSSNNTPPVAMWRASLASYFGPSRRQGGGMKRSPHERTRIKASHYNIDDAGWPHLVRTEPKKTSKYFLS
jgi:hypothetical protein